MILKLTVWFCASACVASTALVVVLAAIGSPYGAIASACFAVLMGLATKLEGDALGRWVEARENDREWRESFKL